VTIDGVAGLHFACGRRTRTASAWWATSTSGTAGRRLRDHRLVGIWAAFIPGLANGEKYKYEVRSKSGAIVLKADPYARRFEVPPRSATIAWDASGYAWGDGEWLAARAAGGNHLDRPVSVYEVHLGSWRRGSPTSRSRTGTSPSNSSRT